MTDALKGMTKALKGRGKYETILQYGVTELRRAPYGPATALDKWMEDYISTKDKVVWTAEIADGPHRHVFLEGATDAKLRRVKVYGQCGSAKVSVKTTTYKNTKKRRKQTGDIFTEVVDAYEVRPPPPKHSHGQSTPYRQLAPT